MHLRKNFLKIATAKRFVSFSIAMILVMQCFFTAPMPKTDAATITLYPSSYTYVKPAPYWTCSPCDEFGTSQQVKILERDYDFFYIEYTRNGVLKRGYAAITQFNSSDYTGFHWCNHTYFTAGYNKTTSSQNTYYTSTGTATFGTIDSDEGEHANKPLLVLRYENSRAFIQYVTNAGTSGHALYKRAWVDSSCIALSPPTRFEHRNKYTLIKNQSTGKYLEVSSTSAGYSLLEGAATGNVNQQWQILEYYNSQAGYYYKIKNVMSGMVLEVENLIPVINYTIKLAADTEPNKGQHFAFEANSNGSYKISTRCSGYYLVMQQTGTTATQVKPTTATTQNWIFEPIHKYWNQGYTGTSVNSNNKTSFNYYIDQSEETGIANAGLTIAVIYSAAQSWNETNANISLAEVTNPNSADIIFTTYDFGNSKLGQMDPFYNVSNDANWDGSYVYINSTAIDCSNNVRNLSRADKGMVLCHELGHALKIMHPYGEGHSSAQHVVYSVMNQGVPSCYPKVALEPSQYDIRTIKNKWGG